jgi:SAM-dependent methyltransferase
MKSDASVVSHFTTSVNRYSEHIPPQDEFSMAAFTRHADKRLKVLEIGCGTGHRLEGLATYYSGFVLFGFDITPAMIHTACKIRPKGINFMIGDCLQIPFNKGYFDAVIIYDILHHLVGGDKKESDKLREAGFRELLRILAPHGFIVFEEVCVNRKWRSNLILWFSHTLSKLHISIPVLNINTDVVVNFYTLDELQETIDRLNLEIVKHEVVNYKDLGRWISTFGSFEYHMRYVLKRG